MSEPSDLVGHLKHVLVVAAPSGEEAQKYLATGAFDLVLTDLVMNGMDGIGVLAAAKEQDPTISVVLLTGFGDLSSAISALRYGADEYLLKPMDLEEISAKVAACMEKVALRRRARESEGILPGCCVCRRVRDDAGRKPGTGVWLELEQYLGRQSGTLVTSALCPRCLAKAEKEIGG
jgi:YesN/AraC family two-component response regulator